MRKIVGGSFDGCPFCIFTLIMFFINLFAYSSHDMGVLFRLSVLSGFGVAAHDSHCEFNFGLFFFPAVFPTVS